MPVITSSFFELLASFRPVFRKPVYENFVLLAIGAVLNFGRQTVCQLLRVFPGPVAKSWSCYHHFLSSANWSALKLAKILCSLILDQIAERDPILLIVDDTLIRRWGKHVYQISVHRDPVRSGKAGTKVVYARGLQWMVISIGLRTRYRSQIWALPVFVFPEIAKKRVPESKYRSPVHLIILGARLLLRWFPDRRFLILADGTLNSHELHRFVAKENRLAIIGHSRMDTVLHDPPPPPNGKRGRPRKVGDRLPAPGQEAKKPDAAWEKASCLWYGNKTKDLLLLSGVGCWYRSGEDVVLIRWVVARDPDGKNKDIVLSTSKTDLTPAQVVSSYVRRWALETTFEESRKHLRIETTENWSKKSIQRTVPLLFGLFSLMVVWYSQQPEQKAVAQTEWYTKLEPSFSDVHQALRAELWMQAIFPECKQPRGFLKKKSNILKFLIHKAA